MPALLSPHRAKRLRRSLYNLQVSISCFVLTILMLRNTIGAGRFGTPAQDFEELKHHLHQVALHRKHARVLAEAIVDDEKQPRPFAASVFSFSNPSILEGWRRSKSVEDPRSGVVDKKVLIVTGSWPSLCTRNSGASAEHIYEGFLKNKLVFSKSHGMEILYHTGSDMPDRLALLHRLMQSDSARDVEWLWWMDSDSLITDPSFELPLDSYAGHNLVLLGNADAMEVKKESGGVEAMMEMRGSFLIRNCEWSLELLKKKSLQQQVKEKAGGSGRGKQQQEEEDDDDDDKVLSDHSYSLRIDGKWLDRHDSAMEWPALVSFQRCESCHEDADADAAPCLSQMDSALRFTAFVS